MKGTALFFLCLGCLNSALPGQVEQATMSSEADVQSQLEYAGAQHEIISILIEEGKYAPVLTEFHKILELGLTGEDETLLVLSSLKIAQSMVEAEHSRLAHQILDDTVARVEERKSKYTLLMYKAKYLKDQGRTQQAIEIYRKAQQLPD